MCRAALTFFRHAIPEAVNLLIAERGGSVSTEHGIGNLNAPFLRLMFGEKGIQQMRAIKALFDPAVRLNTGSLFDIG